MSEIRINHKAQGVAAVGLAAAVALAMAAQAPEIRRYLKIRAM
jgi:hypothetical protein